MEPTSRPQLPTFVGRDDERRRFRTALFESTVLTQLNVMFIRGIGGIGKTTLSRQLADDYVESEPGALAILLDAAVLPPTPTMSALLRMLAHGSSVTSPASQMLVQAASEVDGAASTISEAQPPADARPHERLEWDRQRKLAVESLTFISSAILESQTLSQVTSSASPAVMAGILAASETARNARIALGNILASLRSREIVNDEQVSILLDPETYMASVVQRYLALVGEAAPSVLILIDKVENLRPQLFKLLQAFSRAVDASGPRVVLVFAGRLETVPAADGDEITVEELCATMNANSLDMRLQPFSTQEIHEVVFGRHLQIHQEPCPTIPQWVAAAVEDISQGLPLWVGLVADALVASRVADWNQSIAANFLTGTTATASDARIVVATLLREISIAGHRRKDTERLVAAIAIAPRSIPLERIVKTLGMDDDQVTSEALARYSFMRHDRLHDTVQAAMVHHMAVTSEGRELAKQISALLLPLIEPPCAPEQLLSSSSGEFVDGILEWFRVACWADPDTAIVQCLEMCLAVFPVKPAWMASLLREAVWFAGRLKPSTATVEILRTVGIMALPVLLADVLSSDVLDGRDSLTVNVSERIYKDPAVWTAIGRLHEKVGRYAATHHLSPYALTGVSIDYTSWLITNGFDGEAETRLAQVVGEVQRLPDRAWARQAFARNVVGLLNLWMRVPPTNMDQAATLERRIIPVVWMAVEIDPANGAVAVRTLRPVLEPHGELAHLVDTLFEARGRVGFNLDFAGNLGHLLLDLGRFGEAEEIYESALRENMQWLGGWLGRIRSQVCGGSLQRAGRTAALAMDQARRLHPEGLSSYGKTVKAELLDYCVLVHVLLGDQRAAAEALVLATADAETLDAQYYRFVAALFGNDKTATQVELMLNELISRVGDPRVFAVDLALLEARRQSPENILETVKAAIPGGTVRRDQRAQEIVIIKAAASAGWFPASLVEPIEAYLLEGAAGGPVH